MPLFVSVEWISVTSRYYGNNKTNDNGDGKGERQKEINVFMLTNNNFARTSGYLVHFFAAVAPLRHETS